MHFGYLLFLAIVIALQTCGVSRGQVPLADPTLLAEWKNNPQVRQCGICHFSPGNDFATRDTDFCRMIEAKLWLTNDKHAIARRRIEPLSEPTLANATIVSVDAGSFRRERAASNHLSYAIVSRLGYAIETEAGYAQFRDNCLTCHAGYTGRDPSAEFEKTATNRPGISCNVCHQIGDDTRWIDEHSGLSAKQNWRTLDPKSKVEKGMRSLVKVDDQANLCLKCHVGDIKQNMFVTHQMYAAGHPPLPSIELGALLDAMPKHWRTNAELFQSLKNYPDRGLYFNRTLGIASDGGSEQVDQLNWQTQTIVVGAVAAYQQSLALIEQAASKNSQRWGDYALYDCAACHHELKTPSPRQTARVGSVPGRPRLAEWPLALTEAAFASIDATSEMASALTQLQHAIAETPFGNRQLVAQRASELNSLLSRYRTKLDIEVLKPNFVDRYLLALARTPETQLIDYHVARQINWAIRGIDTELARLKKPFPDSVRNRIRELGVLSGVALVESELPGGQAREIFPSFVDAELKRQSQYDSQRFHFQLKSVGDAASGH